MWSFFLTHALCTHQQGVQQPAHLPGEVLERGEPNSCPSDEDIMEAKNGLRQNISATLASMITYDCGGTSGWRRVGFLDMTSPSATCPSGLASKNFSSSGMPTIRTCGRAGGSPGCWSTFFETGSSQYSQVCGRVRGYQFGATSAFAASVNVLISQRQGISGYYVSGVSLTHGSSVFRTHIWSFAASQAQVHEFSMDEEPFCQCMLSTAPAPPSFVGNDYFCESGVKGVWNNQLSLYRDPLWDGENCVESCCQLHSPPYFTKTLPASTTDDIELRICSRATEEFSDTPIDQVELYVQ